MPREFDIRNDLVASGPRLEPAASQLAAERVSNQLIGDHRVAVSAVDQVDGTPTTVVSSGAPVVDGDLIAAALEHVGAIAPALGLTAIAAPVTFRADPTVLETSSGAAAVNLQQTVADIGVFQAAQTVRFDHAKAIEATTGRTVTAGQVASADPDLTPEQAVSAAAEYLAVPDDGAPIRDQFGESMVQTTVDLTDFAPAVITAGDDPERHTTISAPPFADPVHVQLMWFGAGDDLRLGWEVVIGLPVGGSHFRVIVDAHDGQILYSHELTAGVAARGDVFFPDAGTNRQFRDFPLPLNSYPIPTPPGLPAPFPRTDWVTVDQSEGDNVRAHLANGGTVAGSIVNSVMTFDPTNTTGNDQLRVNLFFFCNFMHDFLYLLGFREADGNFQVGNGTAGGVGNDRVDAFVWPGAVQGTANMFTPADGTAPTMNMGLVTSTNRHTALDSSVVFHEFTHGLSNRLVGGPANAHTLDAAQSGGMGEGWSDYVACTINNTVVLGTWILNNTAGIRGFPYDSNFPDNFGMLGTGRYTEVHNNGEIWCATLMELNRRIGPPLAIQLVVDGLKLTPANPTFLQARDGIISALVNKARAQRWSGNVRRRVEYQAWRAFARFGMGPRATSGPSTGFSGITADFTVPRGPARAGTFDGTRSVQDLVTSPWGVGVWKLAGASMTAPMLAPNGTRFGGWLLNTADNTAGPNGDFDGDGHDEILVTSPWGVGVWKLAGASMTSPMLAPNGTRFGGWLLNTKDNDVGPVGDFDGHGHDEILVSSPWGVGVWKLAGASMTAPMLAPNGTRFGGWLLNTKDNDVGPVGDFDGDGHDEILVSSPWGVGVWKLAGASMTAPMLAPNGTRFGGWLLNSADNTLGPVGDFDGDGHDEILVSSPWGVGVWKLAGASMTAPMLAPNGTRFGGWLLNSADNTFGPVGDFDGDGHDEILVSSPWGVGIWKFTGSSFTVPMMAPNGTRFGGWLLNTADNVFGPVADYDGDGQDEIMVSSPWGVGIWKFTGSSFTVPMMAPNGTRFGGWLLNTADNNLGTGD